ncbi:hypothetical protein J3A78_002358 [Streptomyces sp. PvR006]|uniref:hypothetical protein n=1 Tax=Streptomyces sp. PvR006 TaxID=2817860 RepID=UPI001AE6B4FC|nr:hypothetical protein [Streptomyces sp. PvR006]MBP2581880.1 hypothetical protein [Streptomyces sp. PvR006]
MTQPSPADELRAAAEKLRRYAKAAALASPGTWTITPERVIRCNNGEGVIVADRSCANPGEDADLPYIAAMSPDVGTALAQWLDTAAEGLDTAHYAECSPETCIHAAALAVARAITGDTP